MRSSNQPAIPNGLCIGDRVLWTHGVDVQEERAGIITDILSTQFVVEDDFYNTYIVPFRDAKPVRKDL